MNMPRIVALIALAFASMLSASATTWLTANMPRITGRLLNPPSSAVMPKVSRMMPELSSMPGYDTSMPSSPAESPLRNDPSDSDEIRISAITMTAKFSNGPNATATSASGGASSTSATHDRTPPTSDDALPRPSARPGWPRRAS